MITPEPTGMQVTGGGLAALGHRDDPRQQGRGSHVPSVYLQVRFMYLRWNCRIRWT